MNDWVGTTIDGRYAVVARLGRGGMAAVYRAEDLRLNRRAVALKHPLRDSDRAPGGLSDDDLRQRFQHEIAKLIDLGEIDGVVPIRDQGEHEGVPYFVMPLMEGGSLEDALARGPQGPAEVAAWARRVAEALDALHTRVPPVLHRDVKPANLLFDAKGRVHLADFGIVKELQAAWATTSQNTGIGTPGYMPPEQLLPTREIDARSDQYALAATMYRALTGQIPQYVTTSGAPHQRGTAPTASPAKARKQLKPANAADLAPHLPAAAAQALARALAEDQDARFATCAELVAAFAAGLAGTVEAPRTRGPADERHGRPSGTAGRGGVPPTRLGHSGPEDAPPSAAGPARAKAAIRAASADTGGRSSPVGRGQAPDLGLDVEGDRARRRSGRALSLASLALLLLMPSARAAQSGSELAVQGLLLALCTWVYVAVAMRLTFVALHGIAPNRWRWWVATPLNVFASALAVGLAIMHAGTLDRIVTLPEMLAGLALLGVATGLLLGRPVSAADAAQSMARAPDRAADHRSALPDATEGGGDRWRRWPGWAMCVSSLALGTAALVFTEGSRSGTFRVVLGARDLLAPWAIVHAVLLLACTALNVRGARRASPRFWLATTGLLSALGVAWASNADGWGRSATSSLVVAGAAYLGAMAGIALAVPPWVAASERRFWPRGALGPAGAPGRARTVVALLVCAAAVVPAWLVADRVVSRAQRAAFDE